MRIQEVESIFYHRLVVIVELVKMAFQSWSTTTATNPYCGSDFSKAFDPFSTNFGGFNSVLRGGSSSLPSASQALVLDNERGELVQATTGKFGKKGVSEAKAIAALKSHSEAERRRRERINAHLGTLRGLVPSTEKMDKATLLAEVISQVNVLKKGAVEATSGLLIPMDADDVTVELQDGTAENGNICFKASLCCEFKSDLLAELRLAIASLQLSTLKTEMSSLGGRMKIVFLFSAHKERLDDSSQEPQFLANSIRNALNSVLDKPLPLPEYSLRTTLLNKRRRLSLIDSSSSSS